MVNLPWPIPDRVRTYRVHHIARYQYVLTPYDPGSAPGAQRCRRAMVSGVVRALNIPQVRQCTPEGRARREGHNGTSGLSAAFWARWIGARVERRDCWVCRACQFAAWRRRHLVTRRGACKAVDLGSRDYREICVRSMVCYYGDVGEVLEAYSRHRVGRGWEGADGKGGTSSITVYCMCVGNWEVYGIVQKVKQIVGHGSFSLRAFALCDCVFFFYMLHFNFASCTTCYVGYYCGVHGGCENQKKRV